MQLWDVLGGSWSYQDESSVHTRVWLDDTQAICNLLWNQLLDPCTVFLHIRDEGAFAVSILLALSLSSTCEVAYVP
jgi:hypothetical protein